MHSFAAPHASLYGTLLVLDCSGTEPRPEQCKRRTWVCSFRWPCFEHQARAINPARTCQGSCSPPDFWSCSFTLQLADLDSKQPSTGFCTCCRGLTDQLSNPQGSEQLQARPTPAGVTQHLCGCTAAQRLVPWQRGSSHHHVIALLQIRLAKHSMELKAPGCV